MIKVTDEQYKEWILYLNNLYKNKSINIVTNYRGGLPPSIHLNNLVENSTLSVLKYQQDDKEVSFLINNMKEEWDNVFIDDIYDTGISYKKCFNFLNKQIKTSHFLVSKCPSMDGFLYLNTSEWIIFPWETI